MRVIDVDGHQPGLSRGFVRSLVPNWLGIFIVAGSSSTGLALLVALLQLCDLLVVLRSPLNQTWHDRMAGTYVVRL